MNFGQKFPYALLTFSQSLSKLIVGHTFSQSLSKLIVGHTLSQKFVEADCEPHLFHARKPLPKVVEAGYWGTLHPNHYPHAQLHINPTPHTNYTPTIHNPTTPPIPLLLRVDSDEMWQKPVGFWLMRHWNARERPRSGRPRSGHRASYKQGSSLLDVCLLRARAQTKVDEVYGPYGSSPNPAEVAPSKFPQTLQYFRKSHKQ